MLDSTSGEVDAEAGERLSGVKTAPPNVPGDIVGEVLTLVAVPEDDPRIGITTPPIVISDGNENSSGADGEELGVAEGLAATVGLSPTAVDPPVASANGEPISSGVTAAPGDGAEPPANIGTASPKEDDGLLDGTGLCELPAPTEAPAPVPPNNDSDSSSNTEGVPVSGGSVTSSSGKPVTSLGRSVDGDETSADGDSRTMLGDGSFGTDRLKGGWSSIKLICFVFLTTVPPQGCKASPTASEIKSSTLPSMMNLDRWMVD